MTEDIYNKDWPNTAPLTEPLKVIDEAINKLSEDAGAVLEQPVIAAFQQLYQEDPASYARYRFLVKDSKKVTMPLFDKLTIKNNDSPENKPNALSIFPEIHLWESPVNGEQLLNEIKDIISQYVIADTETIVAATLWAAHTWFMDVVTYAPIANITAPEKRCGKTRLLSVLKNLSYKALPTSNITPAPLFRLMELHRPTLLIDEVDSFLNLDEAMRGIINSGFNRDGIIIRCVGEDQTPTPFRVWGAKALCGIGKIADTLQDRSIPLKLRRKITGEKVKDVERSNPEQWATLRAKLARFAQDNQQQIKITTPENIDSINDRANDCWQPLLQIALVAGGHWYETAKRAALTIHGMEEEPESARTELLKDIKTIFETKQIERIYSHELINALNEDNEANWTTWNKGRGITARNLAKILKEFGILSKSLRIGHNNTKGYELRQFKDTFNRYLDNTNTKPESTSVTATQVKSGNESSVPYSNKNNKPVADQKTLNTNGSNGCDLVTDKATPQAREEEDKAPNNTQNSAQNTTINTTTNLREELGLTDDQEAF